MASTNPVGNVTKMVQLIISSIDGKRGEYSLGNGILPQKSTTYGTVYYHNKNLYNSTDSSLVQLTNFTFYDTQLITNISALTEVVDD